MSDMMNRLPHKSESHRSVPNNVATKPIGCHHSDRLTSENLVDTDDVVSVELETDHNQNTPNAILAYSDDDNNMKFRSHSAHSEGPVLGEMPAVINPLASSLVSKTDCEPLEVWAKLAGGMASNQELSSSLPNLATLIDSDTLSKMSELHLRSSLSDILKKTDGVKAGSLSDWPDESQVDACCKDCSLDGAASLPSSGVASKKAGQALKSSETENLSVTVGPNNNRLSAVLENIPLLYIPHTKQLVSIGSARTSTVAEQQNGPSSNDGFTDDYIDDAHCDRIHTKQTESCTGPAGQDLEINGMGAVSSCDRNCTVVTEPLHSQNASLSNSHSILSQDSQLNDNLPTEEPPNSITPHPSTCKLTNDGQAAVENTNNAESKADASSFSSISSISTGTEFSASAASGEEPTEPKCQSSTNEDIKFVEINLQSKSSFELTSDGSQDSGTDHVDEKTTNQQAGQGAKPKKKGLAGFWSRNLFWKKGKESVASEASEPQGWKLFGKVPPKEQILGATDTSLCESESRPRSSSEDVQYCRKRDVEVSSTTALILEQRPQGLPSKDPEEEERHRVEYDAMVEAARRKEQKEAKQRKRHMEQQLKHEEAMASALQVWNNEILPSWETMRSSRRTRELWWMGIPSSVRGKVWELAIGNDLNLTTELYEICLNRARERLKFAREQQQMLIGSDTDSLCSFSSLSMSEPSSSKEASVELIKLDVSRTFPQLCIFQKGGPYHELLQSLLGAYVCYRPDVGYVQGMSFIAAVLLLNMDVRNAFICFANLLNRPCQIAFFRLDEILIKSYFETFEEFFEENLPKLLYHFRKQNLTPDLYIIDWMFTLYAKSLPLDVASRVWDVFCRDGEEFLFRTALGILKLYQDILLNMDFIYLAQFLTRLPEAMAVDQLFACIEGINMQVDKRRFQQVLSNNRETRETKE